MCFEYQRIKKDKKKGSKFSHLIKVRAEEADHPFPPLGQPDRKISFFSDSPKINSVARDRNLKSATVYLSLAAVFNIFEIGSLL